VGPLPGASVTAIVGAVCVRARLRVRAASLVDAMRLWAPWCPLTCSPVSLSQVGPNGAGKSVLGEAIAFALGGNKKMLRARTLGALINQQRAAQQGCNSASVTLRLSTSSDGGGGATSIVVERSLRGSKVATRVCCLGEGQGETGAGGGGAWRQLTQDQLHDLLLPLGINTKAVDRYVVTQARQAVDVQDPLGLVSKPRVLPFPCTACPVEVCM
jgi:hypothetical protein